MGHLSLSKIKEHLFGIWCHVRGVHRFPLPPGPKDTTTVNIDSLRCWTCGKDFLESIAEDKEVSREQARLYFTSPILNPDRGIPKDGPWKVVSDEVRR